MDTSSEHARHGTIEGNVLVAGCGFIVTAGAWMLFGFLEGDFSFTSSSGLFFGLAVAHLVNGAFILRHQSLTVPAGFAIAALGLLVAAINTQFVLVFTNIVILALLVFARNNIRR
jgi:hypothetical protein